MVGYGALLNSELMSDLGNTFNSVASTLKEVPFYWYLAALVGMFVFYKFLVNK